MFDRFTYVSTCGHTHAHTYTLCVRACESGITVGGSWKSSFRPVVSWASLKTIMFQRDYGVWVIESGVLGLTL